jgi:hypothetical protein
MVELDIANSRMKDFYDIWQLSQTQSFDGAILSQAIRATFEHRETPVPKELPIALSGEFANRKQQQWKSFLNQLSSAGKIELVEVISVLRDFLMPVCSALTGKKAFNQNWPAGEHWQ